MLHSHIQLSIFDKSSQLIITFSLMLIKSSILLDTGA